MKIKNVWRDIPNTPYKHAKAFYNYLKRQNANIAVEKGEYWTIWEFEDIC